MCQEDTCFGWVALSPPTSSPAPARTPSGVSVKGWECDRYTGAQPAAGTMQEQVSVLRAWGWDKTAALLETCSAFVKC